MKKEKGYNLLEALITLCVASVFIMIIIPSLADLKNSSTVQASAQTLLNSIATTRQLAVMRNQPVTLANREGSWQKGWYIFVDINRNGTQDPNEPTIREQNELSTQVDVYSNSPVRDYIRYLPDGRSYKLSGAFQAGHLWVCHRQLKTNGIQLVLSSSGRLRRSSGRCPE
jgi:type IV fimbrial biogenesis protein FimT